MRIELAGYLIRPDPIVIRLGDSERAGFNILGYLEDGYTDFEVICIGGAGGQGGGIDSQGTGNLIRSYGGAGGGGGFHRVRGLLSILPTLVPIVVGKGGIMGADHPNDPNQTTDGGDGGYTSFNGATCLASGGKGGKRVQTNDISAPIYADGGEGGVGNRSISGGGGLGGTAPAPGVAGTAGRDGILGFNNVGQGGGGGAGGLGRYGMGTILYATAGGKGSYNPSNLSVFGPGLPPVAQIQPGGASGATASPLNGLPTVYGQSNGSRLAAGSGIIIVRLTAESTPISTVNPTS
jgi:hypothetical protein